MNKIFMILLLMVSTAVYGQKITVTGTVTDEAGMTLPGATVQVKGTSQGVLTYFNGKFSIDLSVRNATLVFSFVGYLPKDVPF